MGRYGCGAINNNGERFVEFFLNNGCIIGGTILPHTDMTFTNRVGDPQLMKTLSIRLATSSKSIVGQILSATAPPSQGQVETSRKICNQAAAQSVWHQQALCSVVKREFTVELRNRFRVLEI